MVTSTTNNHPCVCVCVERERRSNTSCHTVGGRNDHLRLVACTLFHHVRTSPSSPAPPTEEALFRGSYAPPRPLLMLSFSTRVDLSFSRVGLHNTWLNFHLLIRFGLGLGRPGLQEVCRKYESTSTMRTPKQREPVRHTT